MGLRITTRKPRTSYPSRCPALLCSSTEQGNYKATLDGADVLLNGYRQAPGVIQDVLFAQTGLQAGAEHTLVSWFLVWNMKSRVDQRWGADIDEYRGKVVRRGLLYHSI